MTDTELAMRLNVDSEHASGVVVVTIRDPYLNYSIAEPLRIALRRVVERELQAGRDTFVIDLSGVNVMDSCGLSVLIAQRKRTNTAGGRLALSGLAPMVQRLFELTKLERVFEIHDTSDAARTALSAAPA